MSGSRPPRWLERLVEWAVPSGLSGEGTLGDLAEDFARRAREAPFRARGWYAAQAFSLALYRVAGRSDEGGVPDSDLGADLHWSLRSVGRHPGFALAVVTVLGLGVGATGAVFSVVDGTLANTSWWAKPDRTVAVWPDRQWSLYLVDLYAEEQQVYEAVGGYSELAYAVETADGTSESVNGVWIMPAVFRALAVQPLLGRALADEDAVFGMEPVAVIGEGLWRRAFGADPSVLGARITVSGAPVTVVGIQPAAGRAPGGRAELWFPLVMDPREDDYYRAMSHSMVGVLRPGSTPTDGLTDLMAYTERLSTLFPMFYPPGFAEGLAHVVPAEAEQRRLIATPLLLLLAGTGVLLLVTAINVGNLLLGRATDRGRELAVRAALGAGRRRIVRQLLAEGTVLGVLSLSVALVVTAVGGPWLASLFVEEPAVGVSSVVSPAVLAFVLAVSAASWVVLNGVPVAHFVRSRAMGPGAAPRASGNLQRSLVTVQAALATVLLVSATLLVATVDNLRDVPLGFEPAGLVAVELSPPQDRVATPATARSLYDRLTARVEALPGVRAAGLTGWLPLRAQAPTTAINLRSAPVDPREAVRAPRHYVDPGFFEALGVEAVAGRLLALEDRAEVSSAAVVNEALAALLWPEGTAVGQMIAVDPHAWEEWVPVVGVVPNVRSGGVTGPVEPALYVALAENPSRDLTLLVRTERPFAEAAATLRGAVREVDPLVPVRGVSPMADVVRSAYATSWVIMGLLIALAALATGLGALGIYAVLTHHVALHRREIGVRMALGADRGEVVGSVVRSGLYLAALGVLIGSAVAALATRYLDSLLYEVSTLAPSAFVGTALALVATAAVAAWVPAARAGRLPPAEVLRGD